MKAFLMTLFMIVLCMPTALAETISPSLQIAPIEETGSEEHAGIQVQILYEGTTLSFILPEGFNWQTPALDVVEDNGVYTFENPETSTQFIVDCQLDNQKDQNNILRKLRDKGNRFILFENIPIADHNYLIYTNEISNWSWGVLMLTQEGYSYRFFYYLPEQQGQLTIPDTLVSILSTLCLTENNLVTP